MADDRGGSVPEPSGPGWPGQQDDGRASLAMAGGLIAAIIGGLIWAAIALYAQLEIGWAAWGVGVLVGGAMARITANRGSGLGAAAATLAVVGLLAGKLAITLGSAGALSEELLRDPASLEGAVAWQMFEAQELDGATQDGVRATLEAGDTLSDALWQEMRRQAALKIAAIPEQERHQVADAVAQSYIRQMGIVNGVLVQLGPWDLLWFGLALAAAYRMMAGGRQAAAN